MFIFNEIIVFEHQFIKHDSKDGKPNKAICNPYALEVVQAHTSTGGIIAFLASETFGFWEQQFSGADVLVARWTRKSDRENKKKINLSKSLDN